MSEGFPAIDEQSIALTDEAIEATAGQQVELMLDENGLPTEAYLRGNYGFGKEEASQVVTWGSFTGTVAQMITDEKCPVGGQLKSAFAQDGLEGVERTLGKFGEIDSRFIVSISATTRQLALESRHPDAAKKKDQPDVVESPKTLKDDSSAKAETIDQAEESEIEEAIRQPEAAVETDSPIERVVADEELLAQQHALARLELQDIAEAEISREIFVEPTEALSTLPIESMVKEAEIQPEVVTVVHQVIEKDPDFTEGVVEEEVSEAPGTSVAGETFETPLMADKTYIDGGVIEAIPESELTEAEVDAFALQLADLELTVDVILGEDVTEPELVPETIEFSEFVSELRALSELSINEARTTSEHSEDIAFNTQVLEVMGSLEQADADIAKVAVNEIIAVAQKVSELLFQLDSELELAVAEIELERLCAEFLDFLGVEYDEAQLKQFVRNMLVMQEAYNTSADTTADEDIVDDGTHEFKLDVDPARHFAKYVRGKQMPHRPLGRLALRRRAHG